MMKLLQIPKQLLKAKKYGEIFGWGDGMSVDENYGLIQEKINEAKLKSSKPAKKIEIIAVTKTIPVHHMNEAFEAGLINFGENKVQEMTEKMTLMDNQIKWHMIGHLQRNKVKYIVDKVALIHSVDSVSLLNEINRRGEMVNRTINCLIQVNVSGEYSKFGIPPQELDHMIKNAEGLDWVSVEGLMTMAPHFDDPEKTRDCFKKLSELYHRCADLRYPWINFKHLSMGMSNDFEIALQEGSNMIRIGSALFGERSYR